MARISKYSAHHEALPTAKSWKAGLYLRLSKEDGDKDEEGKLESDSISSQRFIGENFLLENPDIEFISEYSDDGFTGTNFERPEFLRLIEDIRLGKINCVIVKDLSRFGRNYLEAGRYLEVFFPVMNVRFISVLDNIDSISAPASMDNISVSFKNVMNEEYCRDISKKIRSTFVAKRENGEYICGFALYGYQTDPEHKGALLIDPEAAKIVSSIFQWYFEGSSYRAITFRLNELGIPNPAKYKSQKYPNYHKDFGCGLWSVQSVRDILKNRMYTGDLVQGKYEKVSHKVDKIRKLDESRWVIVENHHEPIISKELYWNIQDLMKRDQRISPSTKELALFSGFLRCADCGHTLVKRKASRKEAQLRYHYYTCSTYDSKTKSACSRHTVRSDILEATVLMALKSFISLSVDISELIQRIERSPQKVSARQQMQGLIEAKQKDRDKTEKILLDLYPDLKSGLITKAQYLILKERYETDLHAINKSLDALREQLDKPLEEEVSKFAECMTKYQKFDRLTREILIELVDIIDVYGDGKMKISFKFRDGFHSVVEYLIANQNLFSECRPLLDRIESMGIMEAQ